MAGGVRRGEDDGSEICEGNGGGTGEKTRKDGESVAREDRSEAEQKCEHGQTSVGLQSVGQVGMDVLRRSERRAHNLLAAVRLRAITMA